MAQVSDKPKKARGIRIAIDVGLTQLPGVFQVLIFNQRGGTFTDCIGNPGTGRMSDDVVIKLLSVDPTNYPDAPLEGIRRLLSRFSNKEIPRGEPLDTTSIESIRMGTTVATNALLERKGEDCVLVVTKGFKDCLEIGNQSRPNIFDLDIRKPEVLYKTVIEIDERVTLEDYAEDPERTVTEASDTNTDEGEKSSLVKGLSGETVRILSRPKEDRIRSQLMEIYDAGIKSIAVCLMHSYTYPAHEALVGKVAKDIGFEHISLSSELMPMIKLIPRATSATADAYLTPAIKKYIEGFAEGFEGGLGTESMKKEKGEKGSRCEFMQSDGGLVDVAGFSGLRAILSGPAGGVVGYALTSYDRETKIPVIGFDMGGTSTDVSRYGSGRYDHVFETTTAGVTIQSPQLDINTVAAGGGSRLFWKNGLFVVGPESASAHPGPACYRKGGPLTITDANLYLGRLLPDFFPKIFGEKEDEGLDEEASERLFKALSKTINEDVKKEMGKSMSLDEVAFGFINIANETMTRPIRSLTEARGLDTSKHRLATFGGAGGQHAVAIAEALGIKQILIHRYSSVLSAYGMALADVVDERQEPESKVWTDGDGETRKYLQGKMDELKRKSTETLRDQGFEDVKIQFEQYLNMRYRGTESAIMVVKPSKEDAEEFGGDDWAFGRSFVKQHKQEFGFTLPDRDIIVDDVRVRGIGQTFEGLENTVDQQLKNIKPKDIQSKEKRYATRKVYFEGGRLDTPIYKLEELDVGDRVNGPAILADGTQTIVVTPEATALIIDTHVIINIGESEGQDKKVDTSHVDPIMLSIFAHRFMAIAEQMGRALQKTSVSTNVKERLDYSCALFDAEGGLVANGEWY
jgi:5-oxoprolinase (ATP-hydrolysing)